MSQMMYVSVLNSSSICLASYCEIHTWVCWLGDGLTRPKSTSICGCWSSADTWDGCFLICLRWIWLVVPRRWCTKAIRCWWRWRWCLRWSTCSWDSLRSTLTHPVDEWHHSFFLHWLYVQWVFLYRFCCMGTLRPGGVAWKITWPSWTRTRVRYLLVHSVGCWWGFSLAVKPLLLLELPGRRIS